MAIGDGVSALASLAVTFGGFSPTAMDGVEASREQIQRVEALQRQKKEAKRRQRDLELSRTSAPKQWGDGCGTTWTYVVVDERLVRVTGCESTATRLEIPEEICGMPVYEIGSDACSWLDCVEEIVCPDSIEKIGACAFRFCSRLKRIVLPGSVSDYSRTWLLECKRLQSMVLPGKLENIQLDMFENASLRSLYVGKNVHEIEPGAFQNSNLTEFEIDSENPFIKTDGTALYSIDGRVLLAIACPTSHYSVKNGCESIAKKACYGATALESIVLPDSLREIGSFAFAYSGLKSVGVPSSVRRIDEKAFYHCKELESILIHEGVEEIGNSAFEESGLHALRIPASIQSIGASITERTNIVHSGENCSIEIDRASKSLFLDGQGGLYRREDDGIHLVQLIDRTVERYRVYDGAKVIDDYAFVHHQNIQDVVVPEGVVRIGASALRDCPSLEHVDLPESLREIGDYAFLDTSLVDFRVPSSLEILGDESLVTRACHRGDGVPTLRTLEVAPGNERFYVESGMLCQRGPDGDKVIMFNSDVARVEFPSSITSVAAYAFNNARGIEYLSLNKELRIISTAGLMTWCWIEHIHIELSEPQEGRYVFDFKFPNTSKSVHGISQGIGGATWVNVPGIMAQYDICVINSHDYHSPRNSDSVSIYEQVGRVLERLNDPILLTRVNRDMYERLLRNHIVDICVDVARHDDRTMIEQLVDLGYVNGGNIEEIIGSVGRLQDAAMTGFLLELKRVRFGRAAFDFDL